MNSKETKISVVLTDNTKIKNATLQVTQAGVVSLTTIRNQADGFHVV